MEKIFYDTPHGTEEMYRVILEMQIDVLDKQLASLKKRYVNHPAMHELAKKMLPAVDEMLEDTWLNEFGMSLQTTRTTVMGFNCRVEYKDLFGVEEITDPLEMWAIGWVLIEKIKESLPILNDMVILPQYLKNAMNATVGNYCMSVCLHPKSQGELNKKECPD